MCGGTAARVWLSASSGTAVGASVRWHMCVCLRLFVRPWVWSYGCTAVTAALLVARLYVCLDVCMSVSVSAPGSKVMGMAARFGLCDGHPPALRLAVHATVWGAVTATLLLHVLLDTPRFASAFCPPSWSTPTGTLSGPSGCPAVALRGLRATAKQPVVGASVSHIVTAASPCHGCT
jgi:hypothetical protein